jgi:hypothetical protein
MALNLRVEHVPSLHLFVLLLSAQKLHAEALQLVEAALDEYPDNLNLLYVKAHVELQSQGGEVRFIMFIMLCFCWVLKFTVTALSSIMGEMPYKCGPCASNVGRTEQQAHGNWPFTIVFWSWCVVF